MRTSIGSMDDSVRMRGMDDDDRWERATSDVELGEVRAAELPYECCVM